MSTHVDEKSLHDNEIKINHLEAGTSNDRSTIQKEDFDFTFGKLLAVLVSI